MVCLSIDYLQPSTVVSDSLVLVLSDEEVSSFPFAVGFLSSPLAYSTICLLDLPSVGPWDVIRLPEELR